MDNLSLIGLFNEVVENNKFKHQIKSEEYWKQVLKSSKYALSVLNTIMNKQNGYASDAQMVILNRAKGGDKERYSNKN